MTSVRFDSVPRAVLIVLLAVAGVAVPVACDLQPDKTEALWGDDGAGGEGGAASDDTTLDPGAGGAASGGSSVGGAAAGGMGAMGGSD